MHRLFRLEWDAIAGILAAMVALILHFLHVIEPDVLTMITLVLIALVFIRLLRSEHRAEGLSASALRGERLLEELTQRTTPPDAIVIGPRELRQASTTFATRAHGEMVWFNVCLSMFRPQPLFDTLLKPAIDNPLVTSISFVLDERQKPQWDRDVWPKVVACTGTKKVQEPTWRTLDEDLSFILADTAPTGNTECLLSFWGEPFMSRQVGRDVPRYIFHLKGHSELIGRLVELDREHRLAGRQEH